MKKTLLTFAALVGAAVTVQAAEEVAYGNRPFYGFFLTNGRYTNATEAQYGFAKQTFKATRTNELIHELTDNVGVYAATAIDGIYYAMPYQYSSSMSMPEPLPMFTYNIYTDRVEQMGRWDIEGSDFKPSDMTYDIKNDRLLAIGFDSQSKSAIYEVDRNTGALTRLSLLKEVGGVIAADAQGRIFTICHDGALYQVDITRDYTMQKIYEMPYSYLTSNQSLEFDMTSGKLYWASNCKDNPRHDGGYSTYMVEITLPVIGPEQNYSPNDKYSFREINEIGTAARFQGMYIPYAVGGFEAPGFATDIQTVSSPDGSYCTINFKAPTTTFGGETLSSVDGYDLYRNGERINSEKGLSAGKSVTYEDKGLTEPGEYRYDIVCYSNTKGDGPKSPAFAYVGFDSPAAVSDAEVEIADDFMSATVSWSAPAKGSHGGTFNPSDTRYDVTRLPDNVVIAKDITDTQVKDNVRRLMRYSYRITAKNSYGASNAETQEFIAGTPESEFPVEETFENPTAMKLKWMTVDYNYDGLTWIYGTTLGQGVFGDYEMTAEYIISPTSVDVNTKDADDWIISPPIAFEEGQKYSVSFDIRSLTNEILNVYVGSKNNVESMQLVKSFTLNPPEYAEDGRMILQKYTIDLPESIGGTTACVGLQLATPLNEQYYSYIQLGSINIDNSTNSISAITGDNGEANVRFDGSNLLIDGKFNTAALYSINGTKVADIKGGSMSLSGLNAGIYILNVDGKAFKLAVR